MDARAVVAQLDRATGYELVGWGFESLRPRFFPGRTTTRGIRATATLVAFLATGCSAVTPAGPANPPLRSAAGAFPNRQRVYQPLAVGDSWKFICNNTFTITDRVTQTFHIGKRLVYAMSLQIPGSAAKPVTVVQLLANDADGNTWIYGYRSRGKTEAVNATKIVAAKPVLNKHYDYPAENHGKISRIFVGFENTNRTPLGIFRVAPYFESGGTHNYGYSLGRGVMEEDHGPKFQYDCLIEKYVLH